MSSHHPLKNLVPEVIRSRIPQLRRHQAAHTYYPCPIELTEEITCIGGNVRVDPTVAIDFARGLSIGNDVVVGELVHIDAEGGVILSSGVQVCEGTTISSSRPLPASAKDAHNPKERVWGEVFVGKNVWIGRNACILPGVTIGEGARIAPGALVSEDVPAHATFGLTHGGAELDTQPKVAPAPSSNLPATDPSASKPVSGREKRPDMCFVASTGRSGSTTIASLLNDHRGIIAKHEPRHQLIKLSTDYAYGLLSRDQVKMRLERMFLDGSVYLEGRVIWNPTRNTSTSSQSSPRSFRKRSSYGWSARPMTSSPPHTPAAGLQTTLIPCTTR